MAKTSNAVYIACGAHGVRGAVVETTHTIITRNITRARKKFGAENCKKLHEILARSLTAMMPQIMNQGYAVDEFGEYYTEETFDSDLVLLAVYDHVGNGRQIGVTTSPFIANVMTVQ